MVADTSGDRSAAGWQFWIDRGGTFTDIVAVAPDGHVTTRKVLSQSPRPGDPAVGAIRDVLESFHVDSSRVDAIAEIRLGTTVATNALLERCGDPTVLAITAGFGDLLTIGDQTRPDLFALDIVRPASLVDLVIEIPERTNAVGAVVTPLDESAVRSALAAARARGFASIAIALLHGDRAPAHEQRVAALAKAAGFLHVTTSHEADPLVRLIPRAMTTIADAYLSPPLQRSLEQFRTGLDAELGGASIPLLCMQSNGGLVHADRFRGKDALLSGPAGGAVAMLQVALDEGFPRAVGFDMGGTSTDVSQADGSLERIDGGVVAGVRVRTPMIDIHTVAAGGGSIIRFDGARLRVGPDSAGAEPGPVAYGRGGLLTVTDCNVVLGRIRAEHVPAIFGPAGDRPLDVDATRAAFDALAAEVRHATGIAHDAMSIARGALLIAVENMANAIAHISVERGIDISDHVLVAFGGAGGQHACLVADRLGMTRVLIHPLAGVLSAVGIGWADRRHVGTHGIEARLDANLLDRLGGDWDRLERAGRDELTHATRPPDPDRRPHPVGGSDRAPRAANEPSVQVVRRVHLRAPDTDHGIDVDLGTIPDMRDQFAARFLRRFGFACDDVDALIVDRIEVETIAATAVASLVDDTASGRDHGLSPIGSIHGIAPGPFIDRGAIDPETPLVGPAVVVDPTATTVVEPGWQAVRRQSGALLLERVATFATAPPRDIDQPDPIQLEVFNNLFMHVAEQMGAVLAQTARSVNIKERLDFSCAVFGPDGELVANAPHMPVHLGSMSEAVKALIRARPSGFDADVYVSNAPYNGGTHLPDITVIRPVSISDVDVDTSAHELPTFFVAARGHHADIGGITPGSAPPQSRTIDEEGVVFDNEPLVVAGRFRADEIRSRLLAGPFPARNPDQNLADLRAQVAACEHGQRSLVDVVGRYGRDVVHAYMRHVRANAAESVRRLLDRLPDAEFTGTNDDGQRVVARWTIDRAARTATIDFTGTSPMHDGNLNAPTAITRAAVLYVVRCLVDDDIPLNAGCLEPIRLLIPQPSLLAPESPAAVFAGNVETSQLIVDTLFGALGVMGASQGTMNNLLFGNEEHQYYETICGGAGATAHAPGMSAVHTHMTNSRLTDPEILELRHPVMVESFAIRHGSGGAGHHGGGDGVVRRLRFGAPMTVSIISGRRVVAPYGMAGGAPGAVGINRLIRADGTEETLPGRISLAVDTDDCIEIATPGGGGYGTIQA